MSFGSLAASLQSGTAIPPAAAGGWGLQHERVRQPTRIRGDRSSAAIASASAVRTGGRPRCAFARVAPGLRSHAPTCWSRFTPLAFAYLGDQLQVTLEDSSCRRGAAPARVPSTSRMRFPRDRSRPPPTARRPGGGPVGADQIRRRPVHRRGDLDGEDGTRMRTRRPRGPRARGAGRASGFRWRAAATSGLTISSTSPLESAS